MKRISDLIEAGMKKAPLQLRHEFVRYTPSGQLKACTMACGYIGAFQHVEYAPSLRTYQKLNDLCGGALEQYVMHPVNRSTDTLNRVIFDLNDLQQWSREKIVEWLRTCGF